MTEPLLFGKEATDPTVQPHGLSHSAHKENTRIFQSVGNTLRTDTSIEHANRESRYAGHRPAGTGPHDFPVSSVNRKEAQRLRHFRRHASVASPDRKARTEPYAEIIRSDPEDNEHPKPPYRLPTRPGPVRKSSTGAYPERDFSTRGFPESEKRHPASSKN